MTEYGMNNIEFEPTQLQKIIERDSELYCQCKTVTRLCCAIFPWAKALVAEQYDRLRCDAEQEIENQINVLMQHLCSFLCIHKNIQFESGLYEEAKKIRIEAAIRKAINLAACYIESPLIDLADVMRSYADGEELERLKLENEKMRRYITSRMQLQAYSVHMNALRRT